MKKVLVCVLLAALAGLPVWAGGAGESAGAAGGGAIDMRFATSQPPTGGYLGDSPQKFGEYLAEASKGAIKLTVHHSGSLSANERELFEMAQAGTVDFATGGTPYVIGWSPSLKVMDLPYLFEDVEHIRKVTQGPVAKIINEECNKNGVEILGYVLCGFRSIFTAKTQVKTLEDLKGMKIRCQESPVYIEMFRALGMLPTPMPASELYTSLQTGVVDAGENDPASVVSWGWVDVIKCYMLDKHSVTCNLVAMNKPKLDALPPDLQKAVHDSAKKMIDYQFAYIEGAWAESLDMIRAKGVTVVELASLKPFQDKVSFLADQYDKELGKNLVQMVRDAAKK
ncbi:MAG: TRAP transporter substrate-binding protein [Spirochaetales bacterium]|jgi:tripartite ATP-independent transporter DctP family solute receptor|nr:TRAP transporter substrate-binding protein [Spirochaetales bacterium]